MAKQRQRPALVQGNLSGRVYIVTRYTLDDSGTMTAQEKHDVTPEFLSLDYGRAELALQDDLVIGYKELAE